VAREIFKQKAREESSDARAAVPPSCSDYSEVNIPGYRYKSVSLEAKTRRVRIADSPRGELGRPRCGTPRFRSKVDRFVLKTWHINSRIVHEADRVFKQKAREESSHARAAVHSSFRSEVDEFVPRTWDVNFRIVR